jgi:hypothetical protein
LHYSAVRFTLRAVISNPASAASLSRFRRLTAAVLAALLVLLGVAAVWHPLHEHLHADADADDHECGITLLAVGHVNSDSPAGVVAPPVPVTWVALVGSPRTVWVEGLFARICVLEHAPPRQA